MVDATGVMKELEVLLEQFFGSSTNDQKLQISQMLEGFAQQQGVWRYCVHFVQHSRNEHLLMYSLNLLENLVTHMWTSLDPPEKAELRHFLMQHLVSLPPSSPSLPPFLRNKLIKVVVLIGRADWPHQYPEFFSHILQLIRGTDTTPLGLLFLLTASEELACPRSDFITTSRREELASLLHQQVPTFLSVLIHILESVAEKQRHSVTPTPPPSPNISPVRPHSTNRDSPLTATPPTTHPQVSRSLFTTTHSLTPPPPAHLPTPIIAGNAPYAPLDSKAEEICTLSLGCLIHLFSWMPLSSNITPNILDTIFHFASLGCDSVADITETSGSLGSLAMDCIIELLLKNCVPREFEAFLMKLFEKSFLLLQRLTGESERGISCDFSKLDDRFLAKCSDFFYWFVSSHLKRVEFNPHFPVLEFLRLFSKYTFKQPEVDSFCVCLDTWGVFLDHLIMMSSDAYGRQSPPTNNHYERYKAILISMMESVLKKAQLHYNMDELREIDDDALDDDNETEWHSFLRQSLEFVAKVAELFPLEAFQLLLPLFENYSQTYLSLGQIIVQQETTRSLMISEASECEKLHAVLKDLTSVLQAVGRLSEHFTGDFFVPRLSEAQLLVQKLCFVAKYSTDTMLCKVSNGLPDVLDQDFVKIHAQVLGTLQAFTHWLSQLHLTSLRQQQHNESFSSILSTAIDTAVPLITHDIPEKILLAACQLLLSLASTVRPQLLASLPAMQGLLRRACDSQLRQLPQRAYIMVHQALCHMLVLPWPETLDSGQQWESRLSELGKLVGGATTIFQQLQQTPQWNQNSALMEEAKADVKLALLLLENLVSSVTHERLKSKSLLFKAISPATDFAISLFPTYLYHPDVLDTLMGFFLAVFNALRTQVGPSLTERTTQTFMTLLTREHLEETLLQEGSLGSRAVERFLCILQLLVRDSEDRSFLPSIITFVMNHIYPIISKRPSPEIKAVLYELLFQLLLNNWRYFFPATILSHMDNDDFNEPIEHEAEFFSIMESFGHSFLQPDIAVFKQNLVALETLNSKHKLYSKTQFRSGLLYSFLQILLQTLIQKSHDLLQEEICSCVYSMAAVDFTTYHQEFFPKFLTSMSEGLSEAQRAELAKNYKMVEDLPSFVQNIRQFANDLRYFVILNKSVPAGSVKLIT